MTKMMMDPTCVYIIKNKVMNSVFLEFNYYYGCVLLFILLVTEVSR